MSDFLAEMARSSRARAAALSGRSGELLALADRSALPLPLAFDAFSVIAEVKPRAPSSGHLGDADLSSALARALAYADGGAACVSVLTEPTRFDGSTAHLVAIARALRPRGVPAMRKDFLVDPLQIAEARIAGASGALVIVRMLDDARLAEMLDAARTLKMFVLLEAFDERDLARLARAAEGRGGPLLAGVNCRDLETLRIDRARLARLAPDLPPGLPSVAESGIDSPADAKAAQEAGYRAVLVGTALMRAAQPADLVRQLRASAPSSTEAAPCT